MRPRLAGVVVVSLGLLVSTLGTLTAAAAPPGQPGPKDDSDPPLGRMYESPAEWEIWKKRKADGKVAGKRGQAMGHAAVNYAVVWERANWLTDAQFRTLRNLIRLQQGRQGDRRIQFRLFTAEELRRDNFPLYAQLRRHGLGENDKVVQKLGQSIPPPYKKGEHGSHAEEWMLRGRYEVEVFEKLLEQADKSLRPKAGLVQSPKDVIYGVTERQPCGHKGSPACYRYAGRMDYLVPYESDDPKRSATSKSELASIIQRTYTQGEEAKALRPFHAPEKSELSEREYAELLNYLAIYGDRRQRNAARSGYILLTLSKFWEEASWARRPPRQAKPPLHDNGGIDFSTLELRYMAADSSGGEDGVRYAFTGKPGKPGEPGAMSGAESVNAASDAFFVWLALPQSSFWVNLNPNEPDRIVGPRLDQTDVGRIMLDADLRLKKTVGELIHPDTKLGKRFWASLASYNGERCFSHRNWITPKPAKIYDKDGELYIIDAPLDVKTEQEYIQDTGNGTYQGCDYQPDAVAEHNQEVYRRLILPRLVEAVNTAPEYAALRQIYLSRIAAEWYRERSKSRPMELSGLIDSGDVTRWPATRAWKPRDTYERYLRSYTHGEFKVRSYTYGGVVLTSVPKQRVTRTEFERSWPDARTTVTKAMKGVAAEGESGRFWFGGSTSELSSPRPSAGGVRQDGGAEWPLVVRIGLLALAGVGLPLGFLAWRRRRTTVR